MRLTLTRWVLTVYLVLVLAMLVVAAVRLSDSTDFPGLAAIEVVYLALPWSLALGMSPLSRVGDAGMIAIVLGGLVVNALLLRWLATWLQRRVHRSAGEA